MATTTPRDPLLGLQDIVLHMGGQPLFAHVSLTIHDGDRIGLIGRNGAGKSTLLRVIMGEEAADAGLVTPRQGLRVAMLRQHPPHDASLTIQAVLEQAGAALRGRLDEYHRLSDDLAAVPHDTPAHDRLQRKLTRLHHELDMLDAWQADTEVKQVAQALHLPEGGRRLGELSGGELRRVDLAATVLQRPDLLLLDEPTNHIDIESIQWLEDFLMKYSGSCVLVTHDRYFLENVVNRIVELEDGEVQTYPGNYEVYLTQKAEREALRAREDSNRRRALRTELQWLQRQPKARGTKQQARIGRIESMQASDREPASAEAERFLLPEPPRLGKTILEAKDLGHAIEGKVLFRDLTLMMQKHMRVGIVGPNGCGKTTLLRVLLGKMPPDTGKIRIGDATQFLYVDQSKEDVPEDMSVLNYVSGGQLEWEVNGRVVHIPAYLERFLFDRSALAMPMGELSGGEHNRLDIAKKMLQGGNFLVLDEPTNDLDLPTLRLLEDAVTAFPGCAVIVSHDRYFLNRLCNHLLVFEDEGVIVHVAGNYDDYLRFVRERTSQEKASAAVTRTKTAAPLPVSSTAPRRLTYKEKQELGGIEDRIVAKEEEISEIEQTVAGENFYKQPYEQVEGVLDALQTRKTELEHLYARWAELEAISAACP